MWYWLQCMNSAPKFTCPKDIGCISMYCILAICCLGIIVSLKLFSVTLLPYRYPVLDFVLVQPL